jgi:predicted transcriptional regulator of viral defense system
MLSKSLIHVLKHTRPRALTTRELKRAVKPLVKISQRSWTAVFSETLEELIKEEQVSRLILLPEDPKYKEITRFTIKGCTSLEIATSLKTNGYLSHATAAYLHGLTDNVPTVYYINREQSAKPPSVLAPTQSSINRAFQSKQRMSRFVFYGSGARYFLLSGKHTKRLGVETVQGPDGTDYQVTGIERTLIDCVVRPAYAGGIVQVLEMFEQARDQIDSKKLLRTLKLLDYQYPYHQSIGFLLEKAGFPAKETQHFLNLGTDVDFYLSYNMKDTALNSKWKLFTPKGF